MTTHQQKISDAIICYKCAHHPSIFSVLAISVSRQGTETHLNTLPAHRTIQVKQTKEQWNMHTQAQTSEFAETSAHIMKFSVLRGQIFLWWGDTVSETKLVNFNRSYQTVNI